MSLATIVQERDDRDPGLALAGMDDALARTFARSTVQQPTGGSAGRDGYGSWYGILIAGGPDENPEMMGRLKYPIYREMRNDPAVRSLAWLYKLLIRSADWGLEPAEDDPDGPEAALWRADFAAWQFGLERHASPRLDLTWDELNQQDLLYLDFGAQGGEHVWSDKTEAWVDADGTSWPVRPLNRVAPRAAATVYDIDWDENTGKLIRIRQDIPGADWIPGAKVQWLVNEKEGDNWWGQSLLRAAYGAWLLKRGLMVSGAIAFDRWSAGTPVVRHPPGAENVRKAHEIGRTVRVHERGWVALEGPTPDKGGSWDLEILNGASSIADPVNLLRHYDGQIAMAGLQQFSQLGTTQHGSRAVGDVLIEPFYRAVQATAKHMLSERSRQTLRRLFDVNFGEDVPIPKIKVSKIAGQNVLVLAQVMADLAPYGFSFNDPDTQNDVRDLLDLRHLPDDVQAAIGAAGEAGAGIGVPEGASIMPETALALRLDEERVSVLVEREVTRRLAEHEPAPTPPQEIHLHSHAGDTSVHLPEGNVAVTNVVEPTPVTVEAEFSADVHVPPAAVEVVVPAPAGRTVKLRRTDDGIEGEVTDG